MNTVTFSSKLTSQEKEIQDLEELILLYEDGTLPYDEEDVKVLRDKLQFKKEQAEQVYNFILLTKWRKIFFRIVSLSLWLRKLKQKNPLRIKRHDEV